MTVSCSGMSGGRSLPQSKYGLCTTDLGTYGGAVVVVARVLVAEVVREAGLVPVDLALDGLGVRVEQQLGRVAPLARAPASHGPCTR